MDGTAVISSGNRCGHDPSAPRFFTPPAHHADRPAILRKITSAVRNYFNNPRTLSGLNAANASDRQQRSERREACCAILGAILHYTDLVTLRVGIPQPNGSMAGIPMESKNIEGGGRVVGLAELAGLCVRRAERAVHDLKTAGIITVHPVCEKIDELTYKGYAAIRTVSRNLFEAMGLGRWLDHERRRATERKRAKEEKARRKGAANALMLMQRQNGLEAKLKKAQDEAAERIAASGEPASVASLALATMKVILAKHHQPPKPTG